MRFRDYSGICLFCCHRVSPRHSASLAVWQTQIRMKRRNFGSRSPYELLDVFLRLLRFSFRNRARSWTESQKKANIWARKGELSSLDSFIRATREIVLGTQLADKKQCCGSGIKGSKKHPIPDPDPQQC